MQKKGIFYDKNKVFKGVLKHKSDNIMINSVM